MSGKISYIALAVIICATLVALVCYGLYIRPGQQAAEELRYIVAELSTAITAEDIGPERKGRANEFLEKLEPQTKPAKELRLGAQDFLADKAREAEGHFQAALRAVPDEPDLLSFRAAANLRLGNTALAGELYSRALALKRQADEAAVDLSYDQLGLALCHFMLGRPAEAAPLAEDAWRARRGALGAGHPDTLSAANRLAAIYVALNENDEAEPLLKEVYRLAADGGAEAGAALEEARLFLTVLYNQSGRQEELRELLNRPVPGASSTENGPTEEAGVQEAIKAMRPKTFTVKELEDWTQTADGLAGHNDRLAAELRVRAILGRAELEGLDIRRPGPVTERLALAEAWVGSGHFVLAEKLLREITGEITDRQSSEFIELSSLMAESLEAEERLMEAESHWRAAAEATDSRLAASSRNNSGLDPAEVNRSLDLHLKLAENFLKQYKVAPEAEIELLSALAYLEDVGVKNPADYPAAGRIYLRLADLVKGMNRSAESPAYYRKAKSVAENLLKRNLDRQTRRDLQRIMALADSGAAGPDPENGGTSKGESFENKTLPTADLLRLELSVLAALGRIDEFQPVLTPVLAEAADRFGTLSQQYMRYYSLKLKWLEESGRVEELTRELTNQAADPPGRNEAERALNRAGALIYAARANEEDGREAVAVDLYRQAQAGLEGRSEPIIVDRRRLIEAALDELTRRAENKTGNVKK